MAIWKDGKWLDHPPCETVFAVPNPRLLNLMVFEYFKRNIKRDAFFYRLLDEFAESNDDRAQADR